MHEYKFRGICIVDGELKGRWVYGDLIQKQGKYYIAPHANKVHVSGSIGKLLIIHEVDPKTVGQYTCFNDKNKREIYYGDIVQFYRYSDVVHDYEKTDVSVIKFNRGAFIFNDKYVGERTLFHLARPGVAMEVIGNIYENPEFMGEI